MNHYLHGNGDIKSLSARLTVSCPLLYNADESLIVQVCTHWDRFTSKSVDCLELTLWNSVHVNYNFAKAFQAIHHVMFMTETANEQREAYLRAALDCLKKVSPARMLSSAAIGQPAALAPADASLDDSLLARCLQTLVSLQQFSCVVELCANVARELDPRDEANILQRLKDHMSPVGGAPPINFPPQRRVELELIYLKRYCTPIRVC